MPPEVQIDPSNLHGMVLLPISQLPSHYYHYMATCLCGWVHEQTLTWNRARGMWLDHLEEI